MVIYGNYMIEFNLSKDMKKKINKGGGITFMSNTNCQRIEN